MKTITELLKRILDYHHIDRDPVAVMIREWQAEWCTWTITGETEQGGGFDVYSTKCGHEILEPIDEWPQVCPYCGRLICEQEEATG